MHPEEHFIIFEQQQKKDRQPYPKLSLLAHGEDLYVSPALNIGGNRANFVPLNIQPYQAHLPTNFTDRALQLLKRYRMLMVGGGNRLDKGRFIKHIAYLLNEEWEKDITAAEQLQVELGDDMPNNDGLPLVEVDSNAELGEVLELMVAENVEVAEEVIIPKPLIFRACFSRVSLYDLSKMMQEATDTTVFILPQIQPYDLGFSVAALQTLAKDYNHFLLISTDISLKAWRFIEVPPYWLTIKTDIAYTRQTLAVFLKNELAKKGLKKAERSIFQCLEDDEIVFSTPEQITIFTQYLRQYRHEISREVVEQALVYINLAQPKLLLEQWFEALSKREKLVALGLNLFDGLYDEQLFRALEEFNAQLTPSEDALKNLDYIHLEPLYAFFKLEKIGIEEQRIKGKFPHQRLHLLQIAWNTHRRYVLSVLPVWVKMVVNSRFYRLDPELYGTYERRRCLRSVASNALRDISVLSLQATQNTLLQLAANQDIAVQAVAARALAQWRMYGMDKELFALIDDWLNNPQHEEAVQLHRNESRTSVADEKPIAYIKSTIALLIGYAAAYDEPNHLHPQLQEWLEILVKEDSSIIKNRLAALTLPMVIHHHHLQLKEFLFESTKYQHFIIPTAVGLAQTYHLNPLEVRDLLEEWLYYTQETVVYRIDVNEFTNRDKVLATVIFTYGLINYEQSESIIPLETAYQLLEELRSIEFQPTIKKVLLHTMLRMIERNFAIDTPHTIRFITNIDEKERAIIVQTFLAKYLQQRADLEGEGDIFHFKGYELLSWLNKPDLRPITEIEKLVDTWLQSPYDGLKQIAFYCDSEFTKVEEAERKYIQALENQREKKRLWLEKNNQRTVEGRYYDAKVWPTWWTRIVLFFIQWGVNKPQRKILRAVYPVIAQDKSFTDERLRPIISRWQSRQSSIDMDRRDVQEVANYLERILGYRHFLHKHRKIFWIIASLIVLLLILQMIIGGAWTITQFFHNLLYGLLNKYSPYP